MRRLYWLRAILRSRFLLPVAIAVLGIAASVEAMWRQTAQNHAYLQDTLSAYANQISDAVKTRLHLYEYGLKGARGVVLTAGPDGITQALFRRYSESRDIGQEFPGARGFGYIRRVSPSDEAAFVAHVRQTDWRDFTVRQLASHDDERYVIQYIEPVERNGPAVGLDIASEANRRQAADEAIRADATRITAPITLVQATGKKLRSFLILLPVYTPGLPTGTPGQRRAAAHGWAYAPLVTDEVIAGVNLRPDEVAIAMDDVTDAANVDTFFTQNESQSPAVKFGIRPVSVEREVFGRVWRMTYTPLPGFIASQRVTSAAAVLWGGVFASLAGALLVALASFAFARRREFLESQARVATIVDNASDAIIGEGLDGRIIHWNPAATTLFGHRASEVIGQSLAQVLVPADRLGEDEDLLRRAALGGGLQPFETERLHKDRRPIEVAITPALIKDADGRVIGIAKLMRDVTEQKRYQRQLVRLNEELERMVRERTAALEQTQRDLRTVLDAVPSMIGYWDRSLINRVANAAYHDWFGRPMGTLPGRSLADVLGPELFEANRLHVERVLAGEAQAFERTMPSVDGRVDRHVLSHYIPDRRDGLVHGFYAIEHDVTDLTESRRRLSDVIRENEALLHTIKEQQIYSVADVQGKIIDANERFCEISGYSREELLGQDHRLVQSGTHDRAFWVQMWRTISSGRSWRGVICNRAKDGSLYWVDSIIAPFLGADGKPQRYVSIRHDITAEKRASDELHAQRTRLDNILRGTNVGTWEWNVQTGETVFNERWADIIGRRLEDLAPVSILTWTELAHPDDLGRSNELLTAHFEGRSPYYECEARMRHADGRWIWVLDRGRVLSWTADGKPEWMFGTHMDITERKSTELRLRDSEAFLAQVGEVSGVGGWSYETATGRLEWNRETRRIIDADESLVPTLELARSLYPPEVSGAFARAMSQAVEEGEPFDLELPFVTLKGRRLWIRVVGAPQYPPTGVAVGKPERVIGAFQDVTERHEFAQALLSAKTAAESANAAKSAFLANMSHEIRTPLNAIVGVTHLLADTRLDTDQRQLVDKTGIAARSLLGIVNDVLDLAKIEAGELKLDEQPFQPRELVREVVSVYETQAAEKSLRLITSVTDDLPRWLYGDVSRLRQIIVNMLSNAIKFTARGSVELRLELHKRSDNGVILRATVRDTGIGIDAETLSHLFNPFVQADASTTRRYGGTGLGLSIIDRLARLMGGDVGADSAPGVGSEFWALLPMALPSDEQTEATRTDRGGLEVIVADDLSSDRMAIAAVARSLGWKVVSCEGGQALVQEVEKRFAEAMPMPDALLVDWQMPDMDGLSALGRLAEDVGRERLPAALIVSAYEHADIQSHDHQHLADCILTKPVSASTLFTAVNDAVTRRRGVSERVLQHTRVDGAATRWLAGVRVLLVDDSDINLDVARRLLEAQGAVVRCCSDGAAAISALSELPTAYDVVLMDVQMPTMDGIEATQRIRGDLGMTNLPVVALTAGALLEERRRALGAGMNEFLTKPLDPTTLIRTVRKVVEGYAGAAPRVDDADARASVTDAWPEIDGIDSHDASVRLGGDLGLFRSLLRRLFQDYEALLEPDAVTSAEASGRRELAALMHKLRGTAGTLGATQLHRLAGEVEGALHRDEPGASTLLEALAQSLTRLKSACADWLALEPLPEAPTSGPPLDAIERQAFLDMLTARDIAALNEFERLAGRLSAMMSPEKFHRMRDAIESLDFESALHLLKFD